MDICIRQFWKLVLNNKIVQNSIFTFIPFQLCYLTHLFWVESITFLRGSDGISFQYWLMHDFKVYHQIDVYFCILFWTKFPTNFLFVQNFNIFSFKIVFPGLRSVYDCVVLLKMELLVSKRFINWKTFFRNWYIKRRFVSLPSLVNQPFQTQKKVPQTIANPHLNSPFENSCFSFHKLSQ